MPTRNSDSIVQREVETEILHLLKKNGFSQFRRESESHVREVDNQLASSIMRKVPLPLADKTWVEVDGYCDNGHHGLLIEVYARMGKCKPAQINKLLTDCIKMVLIAEHKKDIEFSKYIAMVDEKTIEHLENSNSWKALAIRNFGVQFVYVPLEPSMIDKIKLAQKQQYR